MQHGVLFGPFFAGREHDAVDEAPDGRRRVAVPRMVRRLGEPRHPAPIDFRDVGVDVRKVGGNRLKPFVQLVLARLQLA